MATLPTITCRAAFGQAFTNGSPTWTDISAYFRRASTRRGRSRLQRTAAQFGAGTATIALDNRDRRFDPTNTASPYYPNIQPGVILNLRATWSGTTYDLFTGYVDNWPARWPGRAEAETEVPVTDLFGLLAKRRIVNARYPQAVLADNPRGYWKLNDPAGSSAVLDYSGSHLDGTIPAFGVTLGAAGLLVAADSAAAFDGTATFGIYAPSAAAISGTGDWTVEAWIQPGVLTGESNIFCQTNGTASDIVELTAFPNGDLRLRFGAAGASTILTRTGVAAAADIHHVVARRSGTTLYLHVDGDAGTSTTCPNYNLAAGAVSIGTGNYAAWIGELAHVGWYPSGLSTTRIAVHAALGAAFVQQLSGARVGAVLDALGFPAAWRRIDTGFTIVPAETNSLVTTSSLSYLQRVEQAEQGQLLVGADGYVEFHGRYGRYGSTGAANQATFGDQAGELGVPVGAFGVDYDDAELFYTVTATRTGGQTQTASTPGVAAGTDAERTAPAQSNVMVTTDQHALYLAEWILADTKQPYYRLDALQLDPRGDANLWPQVLGRVINDVVTVNKHTVPGGGAAISLPSRIEGVDHTFGDLKWQTVFHLSEMGTGKWLLLDDSTCDALDGVNRLGW